MNFIVIIPVRYNSIRFPGKPLIHINDKPMILHVLDKANRSGASRIIIATDHEKIASIVKEAGGEVCMTHTYHQSGTERLAEVVEQYNFNDDTIIVNVQGDEPTISPKVIHQVAEDLDQYQVKMSTFAELIDDFKEVFNPNVVKVVINSEGYALYFSRATIPWNKKSNFTYNLKEENKRSIFLRHIGIYSYRVNFIRRYVKWKASPIEKIEMLEQLRVLWYGEKIHVSLTNEKTLGSGINTKDDLIHIRSLL